MINRIFLVTVSAATLFSTVAWAGSTLPPVQVSEPGLLGLFAGGVVLAISLARRYRK